jgi:hypothetical protein
MFYTGVGSRKTPPDVISLMTRIAAKLMVMDYTLRSGGAVGADQAFELGAGNKKNIFLAGQATQAAMNIAAAFHPAWDRCSQFAKRLHGRNSFQVLGINLDTPSSLLVCWTPDGCINHAQRSIKTGGTGTAISIAEHYKVSIFNLALPGTFDQWSKFCNNR